MKAVPIQRRRFVPCPQCGNASIVRYTTDRGNVRVRHRECISCRQRFRTETDTSEEFAGFEKSPSRDSLGPEHTHRRDH